MIIVREKNKSEPYKVFYNYLDKAMKVEQPTVDAITISSYNKTLCEVDARYVNLKYILNDEWIFFSNYNSKKSKDFYSHDQISALLYWDRINVQIRMKAKIKKTSDEYNQKYFFDRSEKKNALAISSNQSKPIVSYSLVKKNYKQSLETDDLKKCPEYWGGYSFTPYYFEFWEGHQSRLNKRDVYEINGKDWIHSILQP